MPQPSLEELIRSCLDAPGTERAARLEELCSSHPDHAAALRRMYAQLEHMGFLTGDEGVTASPWHLPDRLGNYRLEEPIGRGGMGVVYRARQISLGGRPVALKLVRPDLIDDPKAQARFLREALLGSRLDHPNVCGVLEVGKDHGIAWLAMPFVDGESLAMRIEMAKACRRDRPRALPRLRSDADTTLEELLAAFVDLARGLAHAHDRGLLHRDVKPGNIVVQPSGAPVLLDFGLAREVERSTVLTKSLDLVGTPAYMAPEQAAGCMDLDVRTDVYGLGATLFECLVLDVPHPAPTRDQMLQRIRSDPVPDPRRLARWLPRPVADVVRGALEPDPDRRHPTAAAFADDLQRALERRPVAIRRPGVAYRAASWVRRNPWPSLVGAILLLGLGTVSVLAGVASRTATVARAGDYLGRSIEAERYDELEAMRWAFAAFDLDNSPRTRDRLHQAMRTQRLLARVPVSAGKVLALAFRSDGARLGVATDDGVAVLDPRGSVLERTPTPHSHQAIVAEVDGELVMVLSGQDGTFRSCRPGGDVVDLAGARARPVPREGTTRCAAYDATRGIAAFGAPDGHVYTVDVRAGTVDRWRCGGPVVACAIAGDGTVVAATRTRVVARPMSGEIRVIDVRSPVEEPLPLRLTHVAAGPRPDQVWLGMPLGVGLLDLADDTLRARFMAPQIVDVRSLATDDTYVYVGTSFGTVLRWPHDDPAKTVTLSWHEGVVAPLSVHGERVISVDLEEASVQIGHRGGRRHGPPLRGSSPFIQALAVDPDGDHIATGSADGSVHVWRTRDPTPALQHPTYFGFGRFVFDEDGSVLIAAAGIAARGDPERGVVTSLGRLEGSSGDIPMLALHSGRLARAGSRMLSVHDSVTGRTLAQRPIPVHSTGVAFLAPDLVWVAINGGPRRPPRFQSWRLRGDGFAAAPEEDVVIHDTWQRFAIFWRYADVSRDGTRIAVACYDGTVRVYSRDGSRIGEPLDHCAGDTAQPCFSVAFSGDGKLLLSSGLDGTVKLWHRQPDGRYAFAYLVTRFPTAAHAVDFHPDGERIACTSAGGTIRVMRLGRSTPEEEFHGGGTSYCCRFTPDGTRLSATGYAGWFRTWFLDHDELRRRAAALTEINTGGGPRRRGPTGSPGG